MSNRISIAAAALALVFVAGPVGAQQQRWAFELRGGAAFPTEDVGSDELGTGFGLEGSLRYAFMPHLAAYAGWDWIRFSPDASFAGADMDFEETGYAFGLRFEHPFTGESGGPAWWLRAGPTYDHVEIEDGDGDIIADSGHGFGWEAGAGVALDVGERWSVTPGLRYRSLTRDVEVGVMTTEISLRYLAAELGLVMHF